MDENKVHTSVVIEVAKQEDQGSPSTLQIDLDDLDMQKDYILDQIFCGENITVYSLLELPDDANEKPIEESNVNPEECYRLLHKNAFRKMAEKKLNNYKENGPVLESSESMVKFLPKETPGKESLYSLEQINGEYEVLSAQYGASDLKVLYNKNAVSKNSRSTKLNAISRGINTDIVQSPKIIKGVQKALKFDIPLSTTAGQIPQGKTLSPGKLSCEIIEMEMRTSSSSLSSLEENKNLRRSSAPNFYIVPLLMIDKQVLSNFSSNEKIQKRMKDETTEIAALDITEMVSQGTNTEYQVPEFQKNDVNATEISKTESEGDGKTHNDLDLRPKIKNKCGFLNEMKKLQGRLNLLIKHIELNDTDVQENEDGVSEGENSVPRCTLEMESTSYTSLANLDTFKNLEALPLSALNFLDPPHPGSNPQTNLAEEDGRTAEDDGRTAEEDSRIAEEDSRIAEEEQQMEDFAATLTRSISYESLSQVELTKSQVILAAERSKDEIGMAEIQGSVDWSVWENHKGPGLSKSEAVFLFGPKFNSSTGVKKSLSFDFKDKLEFSCLKKIKNNTFKFETRLSLRFPQKADVNMICEKGDEVFNKPSVNMKCEMGDEAFNNTKGSEISSLNEIKTLENLNLDKIDLNSKINLQEEKGDAKDIYSKQNVFNQMLGRKAENLKAHFCNTGNRRIDNVLAPPRNIPPQPGKPKATNQKEECGKTANESEKPTTPNKNSKKGSPNLTNQTLKKDTKTVKKPKSNSVAIVSSTKLKPTEKPSKADGKEVLQQEVSKQRNVTGNKKATMKVTPDSKVQVDKTVKARASGGKTEVVKPDRSLRVLSQKRDVAEPTADVTEGKEKAESISIQSSTESPYEKTETNFESAATAENMQEATLKSSVSKSASSSNQEESRVVVELFSKKPKFSDMISLSNLIKDAVPVEENTNIEVLEENPLCIEKQNVKSVWALTKVLLFEDGSKKVEILEASLTPPDFSLPKTAPVDINLTN